ncbi:MAG: peptidase M16 [Deltaproteobacteria bacterium HGW-Deltaproteobacteria-19]|jgi:predicted Zn-dependent peptidase|nr:MAG: peptidase M16 [Deltaproteobacteria bacterium HGW-Deltaproteobacteria-19]
MIRESTLDNGIRVVSESIDHVRSVTIGVWVRCGTRYEDGSTNGMSHFVEHMLFKGTRKRSAFDIASAIDSVGGVLNAFTGKELTSLYVKIPDYHLPMAIDLLADILQESVFDPQEIQREKSVVLQEIHMLEDTPDEQIHDFFEALFWDGHPLGLPVLGTKERVQEFSRESLTEFFSPRYCGENLVISAAGRLEHDALVQHVKASFSRIDRKARTAENTVPTIASRIGALEKDLEQVHVIIGTPAPSSVNPRRYAGFLMNAVLGGSMSSRLFQEIREKRGLAYAVQSYLTPYLDTGMLGIYVGTSDDKVREVVGVILDEMLRLANEPLTDRELRGAKELIKGNFLLSMESTDNHMTRLAKNEICFARQIPIEETVSAIDAVESRDVLQLAQELFNPGQISVAATGRVSEKDLTLSILHS